MTMRSAFCAKHMSPTGSAFHAVQRDASTHAVALCKARPATRSDGWAGQHGLGAVTCKRCLVALAARFPQRVDER